MLDEHTIDAIYRAKVNGISDKIWAGAVGVSPSTVSGWRTTGRRVMEEVDNGASLGDFTDHEIKCYEFEKSSNKGRYERVKLAMSVINSKVEESDEKTAWRIVETEDPETYSPGKVSKQYNTAIIVTKDDAINALRSLDREQLESGDDDDTIVQY